MPKGNGKPIPQVTIEKGSRLEFKELLVTLQERFENNMHRHDIIKWENISHKLKDNPSKLQSLFAMESTGGEPDALLYNDEIVFIDCSEQSPLRRSICYDEAGEQERIKKGIKPGGNAVELAKKMGATLLNEERYRYLQTFGEFDTKTSSWLLTPPEIRDLGGALFGDRRYNTVFTYSNGAQSFYSDRGMRCILTI